MEKEVLNLILVEIREMKGDMKEVKYRLTGVETRLTNVENEMSEVKAKLTGVENEMLEVKGRLTNVENDMVNVKKDLAYVKDLAEFNKETSESIRNVVTSHYMEFKKYIKSNNTQNKVYDAKLLQFNKEN